MPYRIQIPLLLLYFWRQVGDDELEGDFGGENLATESLSSFTSIASLQQMPLSDKVTTERRREEKEAAKRRHQQ